MSVFLTDPSKIRIFIQRFYSFVDGVLQRHGDIDELLSKVGPYASLLYPR